MEYGTVSQESIRDLRKLISSARTRGDESLSVLLEGVSLYVSLGREIDLLSVMREFEREMRPALEGTPSVEELERLYNRVD